MSGLLAQPSLLDKPELTVGSLNKLADLPLLAPLEPLLEKTPLLLLFPVIVSFERMDPWAATQVPADSLKRRNS